MFGEKAVKFVENDFYVDDTLKSVPTEKGAIEPLQKAQQLLETAKHTAT